MLYFRLSRPTVFQYYYYYYYYSFQHFSILYALIVRHSMSQSVQFKRTLPSSNECQIVESSDMSPAEGPQQQHQRPVRIPPIDRGYAWVIVIGTFLPLALAFTLSSSL